MTSQEVVLIRNIADGIIDTVRAAGKPGASASALYYAAMAQHGFTTASFALFMQTLVATGSLRRDGRLFFIKES